MASLVGSLGDRTGVFYALPFTLIGYVGILMGVKFTQATGGWFFGLPISLVCSGFFLMGTYIALLSAANLV